MQIGETAAAAGMTAKTLRFYEDSGLLPPADRTPNGYRSYTRKTVDRLEFIRRGRAAGLTLAQIGDVLSIRDVGQSLCVHVQDVLAMRLFSLDAQIAELTALRETVAEMLDTAVAGDPDICDPARICSYL